MSSDHNVKPLRTFTIEHFGEVTIHEERYAAGGLAIQLTWVNTEIPDVSFHEPLAKLSVWLKGSDDLPHDCFFVKDWSENCEIAILAAKSGWFALRDDLDFLSEIASVWQLLDVRGEGFDAEA